MPPLVTLIAGCRSSRRSPDPRLGSEPVGPVRGCHIAHNSIQRDELERSSRVRRLNRSEQLGGSRLHRCPPPRPGHGAVLGNLVLHLADDALGVRGPEPPPIDGPKAERAVQDAPPRGHHRDLVRVRIEGPVVVVEIRIRKRVELRGQRPLLGPDDSAIDDQAQARKRAYVIASIDRLDHSEQRVCPVERDVEVESARRPWPHPPFPSPARDTRSARLLNEVARTGASREPPAGPGRDDTTGDQVRTVANWVRTEDPGIGAMSTSFFVGTIVVVLGVHLEDERNDLSSTSPTRSAVQSSNLLRLARSEFGRSRPDRRKPVGAVGHRCGHNREMAPVSVHLRTVRDRFLGLSPSALGREAAPGSYEEFFLPDGTRKQELVRRAIRGG